MKTWNFMNKSDWGDGPWQTEPDKVEWVDAYGFVCIARRNHSGAWCGYVGIPPSHPFHKMPYDDIPVYVHGGLTYADKCNPQADGTGVCHETDDEDDLWWFGFDCCHWNDYPPALDTKLKQVGAPSVFEIISYKPLHYVEKEIASLARQLRDIESV